MPRRNTSAVFSRPSRSSAVSGISFSRAPAVRTEFRICQRQSRQSAAAACGKSVCQLGGGDGWNGNLGARTPKRSLTLTRCAIRRTPPGVSRLGQRVDRVVVFVLALEDLRLRRLQRRPVVLRPVGDPTLALVT